MEGAARGGVPLAGILIGVMAATAITGLMLQLAPVRAGAALGNGLLVVAAGATSAAFLRKAVLDPDHGAVWRALALAAGLFGVGEFYWFTVEGILGQEVPAISWADAFYFAGFASLFVALIRSFPGLPSGRAQSRVALDGLIVSASMAGMLWILFIQDMAQGSHQVLDAVVVTAYPAVDMALLALLLFLVRSIRGVHRPRVILFAVALSLWAIVDLAYAERAVQAGFASGLPLDSLWLGGYVALAGGAYVRDGASSTPGRRIDATWANVVYIPVPLFAALAVWSVVQGNSVDVLLFVFGIVLLLALAARQVLFTSELVAAHRRTQTEATALAEAQSIARVGSWDYDFETDSAVLSREARRICGLDPDVAEVSRDRFVRMVPRGKRAAIDPRRFDREYLTSLEAEHEIMRADGETRFVVLRGRPEYREGRLVRAYGTIQDVTERRRLVDRLHVQARLLGAVGESTAATDAEGKIIYWNDAAQKMYGWRRDEVLGQPAVDVLPGPEDKAEAEAVIAQLARGESWSGEFPFRRKDGTSIRVQVRSDPIVDDAGNLVGFIGLGRDVTQESKMEIDLRERLKELRALYAVAAAAAETEELPPLLRTCVDALGPAFLHDDTWIFVEIGPHSASSADEKPDGTALVKDFQTTLGKGWIEVRYRSEHEPQHVGPFIQEEVDLLDAVAEMLVSCVDRIQALDELSSREEALSQAQRMTKIGSWKWDPKEDVATWSDEMFEIFERPRKRGPAGIEEALGFFTEESRAALRPELERVADRGGSYMVELEARFASGRTKNVISRGEAVTDDEGRVVEIRGTVQDVTEWTKAQEDLRFQANLLQEVRHAVMATDLEGAITYWNPAASTVFGWEADEVLGQPVSMVLGEQHTDEFAEEGTVDQWMERKDGTSILVNLSSSPLMDAEGRLVGFIGVAQDVTKDRATQRQYQELVENSPNGILRTTPEGSIEYANPAAAVLLGYASPGQVTKEITRMQDLYVDPDDRTRFIERLKDGDDAPFETRLRRRDGAPLWVEIWARLHQRPDGTTFVEGTFHDLSAERMRDELSHRLAAIVESAEEAIYSKSLDGVIETWNHGAERTFGYTADEAIGRRFSELVVPEDRQDEYEDMMRRVRQGRVVPRFETVRQRKDGSRIDYSLALTPIRDASGTIIAASVGGHDISDRKRAQEAERAQIENEHLKEVDQTLRDFINAAAHDLNQPLTPMRLSLAILENHTEDLPDAAQRTVAMLGRSVGRMALLLQDMLDVARLESGTLSFDIKDTSLSALLHETAEFFEVQADEKGIDLVVDDGFEGDVAADDRRVIQVLFNLVGNAMKFTPEGGKITIMSRPVDGMACVEIHDTGPGLTEEQRGKLFKAFSQVHGAGGPKGTGLGLYISRGIIEEHGGEVGVASDGPDKGSTFWFTLPAASGVETKEGRRVQDAA